MIVEYASVEDAMETLGAILSVGINEIDKQDALDWLHDNYHVIELDSGALLVEE